ncbi:MAG: alcohol dehydrogenase catalytic domain-containing protein [Caldilineaceae bacterium]
MRRSRRRRSPRATSASACASCGVCGTDLMKIFTPSVAKPVGIGHEVVGVVEPSPRT